MQGGRRRINMTGNRTTNMTDFERGENRLDVERGIGMLAIVDAPQRVGTRTSGHIAAGVSKLKRGSKGRTPSTTHIAIHQPTDRIQHMRRINMHR